MTEEQSQKSAVSFDTVVGLLLLLGVLGSVALVSSGIVWRWLRTGSVRLDYQLPATNLIQFWIRDVRDAFAGQWRPRLLVNLGIALLMATPYLRVLVSMIHFAFFQRNWKYATFTFVVFSILTLSMFFNFNL